MNLLKTIREELDLATAVLQKLAEDLTSPTGTTPTTDGTEQQPDDALATDLGVTPDGIPPEAVAAEPEPPKDPVTAVVDAATELSQKTSDTPQILKGVKAVLQKRSMAPAEKRSIVQQLQQSEDETLVDVGQRLDQFVSEGTMDETIKEQKLRAYIAKLVDRRVRQLKESGELPRVIDAIQATQPVSGDSNLDAVRSLGLKARQSALAFEADMRKELDLMDINKMDKASQEHYVKAMEQFHGALVASVNDAVQAIKDLPKNQQQ